MTMDANILFFLGRIIYSVMLIFLGANHFLNRTYWTSYAQAQGIPFAEYSVRRVYAVWRVAARTVFPACDVSHAPLLDYSRPDAAND
jgi:hypothetical protein